MYSAARNEKYKREVLDPIEKYFDLNKESSTGMIFIPGMSVCTLEGGIRNLFMAGQLERRQVCLSPNSSKVVWAYRITGHEPNLETFERVPSRYVAPERRARNKENRKLYQEERRQAMEHVTTKNEKPHHTILRMLPVPRFEGYPELEQEAA